jgi:hypothetical protein
MVTVKQIGWLAGLLEGEGCFYVNGSSSIGIRLSMTDKDVVECAARLMQSKPGNPSVRGGNRKPIYYTAVNGLSAASWMMTVWPLMGERRQAKIAECLQLWRSQPVQNKDKKVCKNGHPLTGDNVLQVTNKSGTLGRRCAICFRRYYRDWKETNRDRVNAMEAQRRRDRWRSDPLFREREKARSTAWQRARRSSTKLARLASDSTPDVAAIGESDNRKVGSQ